MLRFAHLALVAVFVVLLSGFLSLSEAAQVTYWMQGSNGTSLGGLTTNYADCTQQVTAAITVAMDTSGSVCGGTTGGRVALQNNGTEITLIRSTAYGADTNIVGVNITGRLRDRAGIGGDIRYELGYVMSGTFTALGSVNETAATDTTADYTTNLSSISGIAPNGSRLALRGTVINNNGDEYRVYFQSTSVVLTVNETVACTETATVAVDEPIINPITGTTSISATVGGTGGSAPQVATSASGPWNASPWNYIPPASNTGAVTFYAQATGFCATITDPTPVATTYDTTCTSTGSLTITPGQTLNGNPINLASITPNINASGETYTVSSGTAGGPAIDEQEYFDTADTNNDWSFWTDNPTSPGTNGYLMTHTTGTGTNTCAGGVSGTSYTPSADTGPCVFDTGTGFLFLENSGSPPYTPDRTFTRNTTFDATANELNISFSYSLNTITPSENPALRLEANDGSGWVTEWQQVGPDGKGGAWTPVSLNLFNGGGLSAKAYNTGLVDLRFVFVSGTSWANDVALDTIRVFGPGRGSLTTWFTGNATAAQTTNTTGWPNGSSLTLDVSGNDATCGTPLASAQGTFTWNSCTETLTLTAPSITGPITGPVAVTAGGTATGKQVSWSENGGSTWSAWAASGATYTPTSCTIGNVIFRAQASGTCAVMSAQSAAVAFDTSDADLATLTTTNPVTANATVVIQTAVGVETVPAGMTGMAVTIGGAGTCNVTGAAMSWNVGSSRWEYNWNTSACGTVTPVTGVTIAVSGTDPDCGNAVAAPQVTGVTIDNTCVDATPSSITIPASQSVAGSSVNLTSLFTTTGNVGSFTYTINGSAVTSPWNSSAFGTTGPQVVTLAVTGTDPDCGGSVVGPITNSITVNNATPTNISSATASSGDAKITLVVAYSGDTNANNNVQVEYGACAATCDGTTFATNLGLLGHQVSPYLQNISGLTNMQKYQVKITISDADGVSPQAVYTFIDVIPSNPMLHNAASTGSTKWGGNWGLPGGKYGEFTCQTCHTDTTTNIKRVKTSISFPNSSLMPNGLTSSSVALTDTRDLTSDFAAAAGNHATSNGVCEVCHTLDETKVNGVQHHAYNMSTATATNQNHFLQKDCMTCHNHKTGFLPTACDACHGNPPITSDTNGSTNTGLVHTTLTGSTTPGAHNLHAVTKGFPCETCHNGYVMPNGGDINISFNAFGSTTGSYSGQTGVSYNGIAGTGGLTCSTVYCHGGAIGGSNPVWSGTAMTCGSCHGTSVATPPATGNHAIHVTSLGLDCSACHGTGYTKDNGTGTTGVTPADHMNGVVSINLGGLGSYSKTGSIIAKGLPGAAAYGTCSVTNCHGTGTPTWGGTNPNGCTWCHNDGTADGTLLHAVPDTNKHPQHIGNTAYVGGSCDDCHGVGATTGTHNHVTVGDKLGDGIVTAAGKMTSYSSTNKNCTNSCHIATSINLWTAGGTLACTDCHATAYIADTKGAMPVSGLHLATLSTPHNQTLGTNGCTECHSSLATAPASHIDGTFVANSAANTDRFITRTGLTFTDAAANSPTCSGSGLPATTCHSDGGAWSRLWSTEANSTATAVGNARCNVCHGQWSSLAGSKGWRTGTTHSTNPTRAQAMHDPTPENCDNCHSYATTPGHHNTATHLITMNNTAGTVYARSGATAGCSGCHGGATDTAHNFPNSVFTAETVTAGPTISAPCTGCHKAGGTGAIVTSASSHTIRGNKAGFNTFNACEDCHPGGLSGSMHSSTGVVAIPNNATVGINYSNAANANYSASYYQGIVLGGDATTGTTEAEICWNCHSGTNQQTAISEWGTNTKQTGSPVVTQYNYGTLSTPNWTTATWTSGTAKFGYKSGAIQSTHSVNDSVLAPGVDAVGLIRCSYCHDVHDTAGTKGITGDVSGKPFLRGTWYTNPYREDGAPQALDTWTTNGNFGNVPRGGTQATQQGGYQIDQNNGNPTTGWTLTSSAGLCTLCHGTNVDTMNKFGTASTDWVGTNGHANAVIGGTGTGAADIFSTAIRNPSGAPTYTSNGQYNGQPAMAYQNAGGKRGYGLRGNDGSSYQLRPSTLGSEPYAYQGYNWGANVTTGVDPQYHKFSCSKCHNPHASRLPRLMISNCLDTKHNTWDDQGGTTVTNPITGTGLAAENTGVQFSNATSAQNCHRLADKVNYPQAAGNGWNNVTPW